MTGSSRDATTAARGRQRHARHRRSPSTRPRRTSSCAPTPAPSARLDAVYVTEHLQHAYALTAHTIQGGTVEWAGVVGHPDDFTRNWSYTALSRARQPTELFLIDAPTERELDRADIAPNQPAELRDERTPVERLDAAMRRRDDEDLALDRIDPIAHRCRHLTAPTHRPARDRQGAQPASTRPTAHRARAAARTDRPLPRTPRRPAPRRTQRAQRGAARRRPRAARVAELERPSAASCAVAPAILWRSPSSASA